MSVVKKGITGTVSAGGPRQFVSINPDSSVTVVPLENLDEVVNVQLHSFWDIRPAVLVPCLKTNCPACDIGNEPRFRAYIPVLLKGEGVQILSAGSQIVAQLQAFSDEVEGGITGQVFKIKRTGSGLSTRYAVVPLGKKVDVHEKVVPDVVEAIGPVDRAGIVRKLFENDLIEDPSKYVEDEAEVETKEDEPESGGDDGEDLW